MSFNPCPKPISPPKAPKTMRKRNAARQTLEFKRTYHSRARQKFVTLGPCAACGSTELCDNAHVLGTEGTGLKKGYKTIAPLCRPRLDRKNSAAYEGCHQLSHRDPEAFRMRYPKFNPERAARDTERRWKAFCADSSSRQEPAR
jgi:hypothetical protein